MDAKLHVISKNDRPSAIAPDSLIDMVMADLFSAGFIERYEQISDDDVELSPLDAINQEIPIGLLQQDEKRAFLAAMFLDDVMENFLREKNAEIADRVAAAFRDKEIKGLDNVVADVVNRNLNIEDVKGIMRLSQSYRMVHDLYSYSVRKRLNQWGKIGVRKGWVLVTY